MIGESRLRFGNINHLLLMNLAKINYERINKMAKFRKKPVVIEALQWTGDNMHQMIEFSDGSDNFGFQEGSETMTIDTLEGVHTANKGDWIMRGVHGEFYPCKPDIFEATYELV